MRAGSPQKIFASIAGSNDLISYYDGSAVYIYLSPERTTRYVNLPPARVEDFVGAFQKMKLGDDANSFSATSGNGLVMITGTPRFVEQVLQLADAVNGQGPSNATVFKYYKLRYAWAADMTMTISNRQQVRAWRRPPCCANWSAPRRSRRWRRRRNVCCVRPRPSCAAAAWPVSASRRPTIRTATPARSRRHSR